MLVSFTESDASLWVSACSQASLVPHPDTGRDELSWVRASPASSQNTHAHSARAVAAQASRASTAITDARRSRIVRPLLISRLHCAIAIRIGPHDVHNQVPSPQH